MRCIEYWWYKREIVGTFEVAQNVFQQRLFGKKKTNWPYENKTHTGDYTLLEAVPFLMLILHSSLRTPDSGDPNKLLSGIKNGHVRTVSTSFSSNIEIEDKWHARWKIVGIHTEIAE